MTLVDRLLELHQMWVEYINEVGKVPTDEEIKEIETIKKQLEENEEKAQDFDRLQSLYEDEFNRRQETNKELVELKALHRVLQSEFESIKKQLEENE